MGRVIPRQRSLTAPRPDSTWKRHSWLSDQPRHAPLETQAFLFNIAFLECTLERDPYAREDFLEIICDLTKPGCQAVIDEAKSEHFNAFAFAGKLLRHGPQSVISESPMLQRVESELAQETFENYDLGTYIVHIADFIKAHCNSEADFADERCRVTIVTAKALYGAIVLKSLYEHLGTHPEDIDRRRLDNESQSVIMGNPTQNRLKTAKAGLVKAWKELEWTLHNDAYYMRKAEIFYRATVNPGKLVDVVSEIASTGKANPASVKRRLERDIGAVRSAITPTD